MKRIESLSDGVFAIAMTLLVLNVHLASSALAVGPQLPRVLPSVAAYVLSFAIAGMFWVAHHTMLGTMKDSGRALWWPNLLVLLTVAFIPFPAGVLGTHPLDAGAILLYGATLSAVNLAGVALWATAAMTHCLDHVSRSFVRNAIVVHAAPVALYAVAIAAAPSAPVLSLCLYAVVPLFFIASAPWLPQLLGFRESTSREPSR